jgi:hypothetical protein
MSCDLPYDPDTHIQLCAPTGKWRVVELTDHTMERMYDIAVRVGDHDLKAEADYYLGISLRSIIGDFDDFREASLAVDKARYPNRREMFNDMGVSVMFMVGGGADVAQAGTES